MLIPLFPLIAHLLPAKGGTYRAKGPKVLRSLFFGRVWATVSTCDSHAQASRIARELNAYASR